MAEALEWVPGGAAGAVMLAGAVAAGTYYMATRPTGTPPMFPLDEQAFLEPVSSEFICKTLKN